MISPLKRPASSSAMRSRNCSSTLDGAGSDETGADAVTDMGKFLSGTGPSAGPEQAAVGVERLAGGGGIGDVEDRDRRALGGQPGGVGAARALCAACGDRDASGEPPAHADT